MWDLVGFEKPLKSLKQWDDKLSFYLASVKTGQRAWRVSLCADEDGCAPGKGCFEATQLISGIAGPKTPAVVFAIIDIYNIVFHS